MLGREHTGKNLTSHVKGQQGGEVWQGRSLRKKYEVTPTLPNVCPINLFSS